MDAVAFYAESTESSRSPVATLASPRLPRPCRLPRDGPTTGGGYFAVADRIVFETQVREAGSFQDGTPAGLDKRKLAARAHGSPGRRGGGKATGGSAAGNDSPRSSTGGKDKGGIRRVGPEERRRQEMLAKWEKTEAVRNRDHKLIVERIDKAKIIREARFKRLLTNVSGEGNLAYETAIDLRDREAHQEQRRRGLHQEWEDKVFAPLATQAHGYLNPPDRRAEQALAGSKSVAFTLPDQQFKLTANWQEDPARRQLVEHARENAFHQAAESVLLGRSQSAPTLRSGAGGHRPEVVDLDATGRAVRIPKPRSKEVLDPTVWSQHKIQDTLYGFWAQAAEQGSEFKRVLRGGPDVHLPDESDGVNAAGTRASRTAGFHDKGILRGDRASRGELAQFKTHHGVSSGAPGQDHYTFETGTHITDLEFPLGKRPPPPGIPR